MKFFSIVNFTNIYEHFFFYKNNDISFYLLTYVLVFVSKLNSKKATSKKCWDIDYILQTYIFSNAKEYLIASFFLPTDCVFLSKILAKSFLLNEISVKCWC